jgi:hypothetical protein
MNHERMEIGRRFWSLVWFSVAEKVVATAGQVYELSPEQQAALKRAFLRSGDYLVRSSEERSQ